VAIKYYYFGVPLAHNTLEAQVGLYASIFLPGKKINLEAKRIFAAIPHAADWKVGIYGNGTKCPVQLGVRIFTLDGTFSPVKKNIVKPVAPTLHNYLKNTNYAQ
jgi:hypothetical protein